VGREKPGSIILTIAILPGSFDPITNGHLDLLERGLKMFERVIVAVLNNDAKTPLFSAAERQKLIHQSLEGRGLDLERIEVDTFEGLLVEYARSQGAKVIIRGLRAVSDFEYELQMAMMNRNLAPDLETVFLMPQNVYSYLSSRMVKNVASLNGDISNLVPAPIDHALKAKFGHL
jgi:pantetheine-phosphate adenylyltransferase